MRRYFILIAAISFICSMILLFYFNYSVETVSYHLLLALMAHTGVFYCCILLFVLIKNQKIYRLITHFLLFIYLQLLLWLYIMILSSNYFWKKTITFSVIKNYFFKLNNFIASLPVEGWIFYTFFSLVVVVSSVAYYICRPQTTRLYSQQSGLKNKKVIIPFLGSAAFIILLVYIFYTPIMQAKRTVQFAEEPILQFFLGGLWGKGNEVAFDKERFVLGTKDAACLDSLQLKPKPEDHTVVIIVVDALRNDHLPMYGYRRNTTPFLDSLYKAGDVFSVQHAFSPCTNTVGGIAGLFYSRDWTEFGYNGLNIMKYLKQVNYTTYSFLTGYHRDWFGLSALYRSSSDYYYESPKDPETPPDDDLVTMNKIKSTPIKKRSLTYIHLLSTHTIGKKDPSFRKFLPDKMGIGVDQKLALENNYDNGILQADYAIRQVFEKLKNDSALANCTVFITSDHGELFGEDGRWSHGGSVQPNLISVPLLIYDRDKSWYKNLTAATLKDIAPTIADRLGYAVPACWEGRSLHQPVQDFTLEINSVTESEFPFGLLIKSGNSYLLQIMNKEKEIKKTASMVNNVWHSN